MLTSSQISRSPPRLKRHAFKRRKLSSGLVASPSVDLDLEPLSHIDSPFLLSFPAFTNASSPLPPPPSSALCTSCHRSLTTKTVYAISCEICASTTCAVCSRTCTARAPSLPPTPGLTYSPTPTSSPRRMALSLNTANTNGIVANTGKRKKDGEKERDLEEQEGAGTGCGRIICRNCCFENLQGNFSTTCYDCYSGC